MLFMLAKKIKLKKPSVILPDNEKAKGQEPAQDYQAKCLPVCRELN